MMRTNPNHDPHHRSMRWDYKSIKPQPQKDNDVKKYDDIKKVFRGSEVRIQLEDEIRKAIRNVRDYWRTPYSIEEIDEEQWRLPESERKYKRVYYTPEDQMTIRQLLAEDDAKYRNTFYARRFQRIRVPSLKRSNKEWENFYRTWPGVAVQVAIGEERFIDGAKLKYIPLFKKILDEEWPEDLKMWTVEQYDMLKRKGEVK